jgi:hypothetical protein
MLKRCLALSMLFALLVAVGCGDSMPKDMKKDGRRAEAKGGPRELDFEAGEGRRRDTEKKDTEKKDTERKDGRSDYGRRDTEKKDTEKKDGGGGGGRVPIPREKKKDGAKGGRADGRPEQDTMGGTANGTGTPDKPKKPVPPKTPTVWKKDASRPTVARVYVGDGNSLELVSLHVSVQVEGARARTLVDHVFRNPHDRRLEGQFEYPLPAGASPSYFAMFLGASRDNAPPRFRARGD